MEWVRTYRTPTQYASRINFSLHSTHYSVQWQSGNSVEDSASMGDVARDFSCVMGVAALCLVYGDFSPTL